MLYFFVKDTATPENYTYLHNRSLHDALPIYLRRGDARWAWSEQRGRSAVCGPADRAAQADPGADADPAEVAGERGPCRRHGRYGGRHPADRDRKSTRLNSSH